MVPSAVSFGRYLILLSTFGRALRYLFLGLYCAHTNLTLTSSTSRALTLTYAS